MQSGLDQSKEGALPDAGAAGEAASSEEEAEAEPEPMPPSAKPAEKRLQDTVNKAAQAAVQQQPAAMSVAAQEDRGVAGRRTTQGGAPRNGRRRSSSGEEEEAAAAGKPPELCTKRRACGKRAGHPHKCDGSWHGLQMQQAAEVGEDEL